MKNKFYNLGFSINHFLVLMVAFIVLGSLAFSRSGINLKAMFASAQEEEIVTYEETYQQIAAELKTDVNKNYNSELEESYKLVDRGSIDGKVLGEAIGIGEVPDASEIILPELKQIYPVRVLPTNSETDWNQYLTIVQAIEESFGVVSMTAMLNSPDQKLIKDSLPLWDELLQTFSLLEVPQALAEYHDAKLGYYFSMYKMGQVYAGVSSDKELDLYLKAMLAYGSRINEFERLPQ